jgi:(1->4)-alpha-D-glucan 1-alpha-D-glucosylmutase
MTATSTHDSKRGEDVRAKLAVLTEMPDEWGRLVEAWSLAAREHETKEEGETAPGASDAYLFFQTVVGALPLDPRADPPDDFADRVCAYMAKAAKEAKTRTSWIVPNDAYDAALARFCREMLQDARFLDEARALAARIAPHGASNGLTQAVLKLCSPGVADVYQGSEAWNLSLVDPDNRRRVDFDRLGRLLADDAPADELLRRFWDGAIKVRVTRALLAARRADPELFVEGAYEPIDGGEHVVAFARRAGERVLVAIAARLPYGLVGGEAAFPVDAWWGDASIAVAPGVYEDLLTGARLEVGPRLPLRDALRTLPVAALKWRS